MIDEVMEACLNLIQNCPCEDGCPSCVGSPIPPYAQNDPDATSRGRIPDKDTALIILHNLLEKEPYVPAGPPKWAEGSDNADGACAGYSEEDFRIDVKPCPTVSSGGSGR